MENIQEKICPYKNKNLCGAQKHMPKCNYDLCERCKRYAPTSVFQAVAKRSFTFDEICAMYELSLQREEEYKKKINDLKAKCANSKLLNNNFPFEFDEKVYIIDSVDYREYHSDVVREYYIGKNASYIVMASGHTYHISKIGIMIFKTEKEAQVALETGKKN